MLITLPPEFVHELAVARTVALKTCDQHFTLTDADVAQVRRFIELYQQELAWVEPARAGGTGGRVAPPGGWPEWKPVTLAPALKGGSVLDGSALFKLLSPSVFEVVVQSSSGTMQGSAVAISTSQLLTNCHVVEGAQKITLQQSKKLRSAQLLAADPVADRCILSVDEATLSPIRGTRQRADLEVGEPLYTLGAPNGLELSLTNGVLSGIREEDGRSYVQTSAAISPGSSGGGLFDSRGNLVGITTMMLVGRERLNQSLNFAIPAESFASP